MVKNYTDNKAISAPSMGLAGWLGLSLAINYGLVGVAGTIENL